MDIVRGKNRNIVATENLIKTFRKYEQTEEIEGTLYIGYPLAAQDDSGTTVDALLVSKNLGLVAFIYYDPNTDAHEKQDDLYFRLEYTLRRYVALRNGRNIAVSPLVVTYYVDEAFSEQSTEQYYFANHSNLEDLLNTNTSEIELELYNKLVEALQKISSMKPKKKRNNVKKLDSYGAIIKQIELEVASLDEWQKKAAYEIPRGVQRIRGLAGSGKTVVLALKAAYLHAQYPEWNIAVTFYTRSLAQQFRDMINNFYKEFTDDLIDDSKLHILHAWGTNSEEGVYSQVCDLIKKAPLSYSNAESKYGRKNAFRGIVDEVLLSLPNDIEEIYDAMLIDEAQDMPANFFKLCYKITKQPKRVVYAYDELQNLNEEQMASIDEMFGKDEHGNSLVELENKEDEPRKDIVLPVCYRNTPWALTIAHALGFGIYRQNELVQFFENLELWEDIGYERISGNLEYEKNVSLKRSENSVPIYFNELLVANDAVKNIPSFTDIESQYEWVAREIQNDINERELDPDDILVIFPNAITAKKEYMMFRNHLAVKGIDSNLAGVTTSRDIFKVEGHVTCSSIYRAKGNEAPMVYIVNANTCVEGPELIKLRNTLFTAVTRSRGWVRILGVGTGMTLLNEEIEKCKMNDFTLKFTIPTRNKIAQLRLVHKELSQEEKRNQEKIRRNLDNLKDSARKGELDDASLLELVDLIKKNGGEKFLE